VAVTLPAAKTCIHKQKTLQPASQAVNMDKKHR